MEEKLIDHGSRIGRLESDLDRIAETLGTVVKLSAATSADVHNLTKQVGNLFSKSNRPIEWAALIAAIGLLFAGSALLIAPVKEDIREGKQFDIMVMSHLLDNQREAGERSRDIEWLKMLENRSNERIHRSIKNAGDATN